MSGAHRGCHDRGSWQPSSPRLDWLEALAEGDELFAARFDIPVAAAAVRQLVERSRAAGVDVVTAHTLDEANRSTSLLERCGFALTGEVADIELGVIWRWELPLGRAAASARRGQLEPAESR